MNYAIVIHSNDAETVWNAFRFASTALAYDNKVTVFLLGRGVEAPLIGTLKFDVKEQMDLYLESGGEMLGCGVCCESRVETMPFLREQLACELGSMQQLYALTAQADRVLNF